MIAGLWKVYISDAWGSACVFNLKLVAKLPLQSTTTKIYEPWIIWATLHLILRQVTRFYFDLGACASFSQINSIWYIRMTFYVEICKALWFYRQQGIVSPLQLCCGSLLSPRIKELNKVVLSLKLRAILLTLILVHEMSPCSEFNVPPMYLLCYLRH